MAGLAPYIPNTDGALDTWALNFSTLITATPATYGLGSGDAVTIAGVYTTWHASFLSATNPGTKTKTTVAAKNTARVNLLAICRPYATMVSNNAGVSSADKTTLGVNPRTSVPTPISAPTSRPVLTFINATPLASHLRYSDSVAGPLVKSKPYGVIGLQFFGKTSSTAITDPALLPYFQQQPTSPFTASWESGDVGKTAYVAARWITRKGLVGPWSDITSFTVA